MKNIQEYQQVTNNRRQNLPGTFSLFSEQKRLMEETSNIPKDKKCKYKTKGKDSQNITGTAIPRKITSRCY